MKKIISLILVLLSLTSLMAVPALSADSESDFITSLKDIEPDFNISAKLYELIDRADINSLSQKVKDYLNGIKNMSDEEIVSSLHDFCKKYDVALSDSQLESAVKLLKKVMDYDVDDIKGEINSLREKAGILVKIAVFIKNAVNAIANFFSSIGELFSGKAAE